MSLQHTVLCISYSSTMTPTVSEGAPSVQVLLFMTLGKKAKLDKLATKDDLTISVKAPQGLVGLPKELRKNACQMFVQDIIDMWQKRSLPAPMQSDYHNCFGCKSAVLSLSCVSKLHYPQALHCDCYGLMLVNTVMWFGIAQSDAGGCDLPD